MSKHTKGPWILSDGQYCKDVYSKHYKSMPKIAEVLAVRNKEFEANARLIAAAPELLEALHFAIKELKRIQREGAPQPMMVSELAIGLSETAINKAEGKE